MKLTIETLNSMMDQWGNLYLSGTEITALPDGLTVGGGLDLSGTKITALPDGLTVGGSLYLSGTEITALPDGLTVGGYLYLDGTKIKTEERKKVKKLNEGDFVPGKYLFADGVITHINRKRRVGRYTYYQGKIPGRSVVTDGVYYAHCKSLREGIEDLKYKSLDERDVEQFRGMSMDTELTVEEAMAAYRRITGACRRGTEMFVAGIQNLKKTYTLQECIDLTRGQYGWETFRGFFEQ